MDRIIKLTKNSYKSIGFVKPWNIHLNIDLDYNIENLEPSGENIKITIPNGTINCTIGHFIRETFKRLPRNRMNNNREFNLIARLFLVALKDRRLRGDQTEMIEEVFSNNQEEGHLYWIILELFKSVSRMASRIRLDVPDIVRYEYWAWQCFFIKDIQDEFKFKSKKQIIRHLRKLSRAVRSGENPFSNDSPEMRIFIDYAFSLSSSHESHKKDPNDIRTLRKHIRQRLNDLHKALSAYATYLERSPCKLLREEHGKPYEISNNGHMKRLKEYVEPL
jgi:hypothetical protein